MKLRKRASRRKTARAPDSSDVIIVNYCLCRMIDFAARSAFSNRSRKSRAARALGGRRRHKKRAIAIAAQSLQAHRVSINSAGDVKVRLPLNENWGEKTCDRRGIRGPRATEKPVDDYGSRRRDDLGRDRWALISSFNLLARNDKELIKSKPPKARIFSRTPIATPGTYFIRW